MGRLLAAVLVLVVGVEAACSQPPGGNGAAGEKGAVVAALPTADADLRTEAERSEYRRTARYEQVVSLMDALAAKSKFAKRLSMGKTQEGREIPLLVVADPPVEKSEQVAKRGERVVVLMLGNIHAGEVDGKEALPMLAREMLLPEEEQREAAETLRKKLVVVFAPIYNADGNEKLGDVKERRPEQVGPEEGGVGTRENSQGLDLNRDFVKAEAPETRALLKFLRDWDPDIVVDTHTTDGSFHRYMITYTGPKVPAGDAAPAEYVNGTMLPKVGAAMKEKSGYESFWYGNFEPPTGERKAWETFPAEARYGTSYVGLRGRIGILSEAYSHAPFKERVLATRAFCRAVLEFAAANRGEIRKVVREADKAAVEGGKEPKGDDVIALRTKASARGEKVNVKGWVEEERGGVRVPTEQTKEYEVELRDRFEATVSVKRPWAYVLQGNDARRGAVVEVLQRHGVEVEELREDVELDVEAYTVEGLTKAGREFQKHRISVVDASAGVTAKAFTAGTIVVRTGQKLGRLASYLLEPMCEDGLTTWNFFDEGLEAGKEFPVARIIEPIGLVTTRVRPLAEDRTLGKAITFEEMYESEKSPNFGGSPVGGLQWLEDGSGYLQVKDGKLWKVDARSGRMTPFRDPKKMEAALASLPTIGDRAAKRISERTGFQMTKDRSAALIEHGNDLYYCRFDGGGEEGGAKRLTSTPEEEEMPSFSPDGKYVAFVRANDLYVVDVATATERRLTTGGTDLVRHGKNTWLYYEEIFGRDWGAYWWSPDSARIAFLEEDSTHVPVFTVVDETKDPQTVERTPYPKPGQTNPSVRLGVVEAIGGDVAWADLSDYDAGAFLITGVQWWKDSSAVMAWVQDRTQTWLDVCSVSHGGDVDVLFRETTGAWVDQPGDVKFLEDGSFVMLLERSGYKHMYHFGRDGKPMGASKGEDGKAKPIVDGEWEDRQIVRVGEEKRDGKKEEGQSESPWVYFKATKESSLAENFYRVRLDGTGLERLTTEAGSHGISMAPKGDLYVDSWSSFAAPTRVVMRTAEAVAGKAWTRTLDSNPVYSIEEYTFGKVESVRVPVGEGEGKGEAPGLIFYPPDFDATKEKHYPVWVLTYAGPHTATISDSWGGGRTWEQVLAQAGVVVLRMDPRTAAGTSAKATWACYKQMGVVELADLEAGVRWIAANPWADAARVGMHGHSYGGFMTAYALTHSRVFAAGIAGAPVTDWRDYDSIYTERMMLTPQENKVGYDKTSVVKAAKNLHGKLLLVHGHMDDNVHPQNSYRFARALQQAGKQFEMAVYPTSRHGIGGKQYQRLMYEFIRRTMGVGEGLVRAKSEERTEKSGKD